MSMPAVTGDDTCVRLGEDKTVTPEGRWRALVTAPLRGPGFEKLRTLVEVIYDPWIDQTPLRIYDDNRMAARLDDEDVDLLVVESDFVGTETLSRPLRAVASMRGDPNNIDIA